MHSASSVLALAALRGWARSGVASARPVSALACSQWRRWRGGSGREWRIWNRERDKEVGPERLKSELLAPVSKRIKIVLYLKSTVYVRY